MTLSAPYPADLVRVARKVVWYDSPEEALVDLADFLTHLMVYGSSTDVAVVERYIPLVDSGSSLRTLLLESLQKRFGVDRMNDLACLCHRCRVAGSRMVPSVRRRADSSAGRQPLYIWQLKSKPKPYGRPNTSATGEPFWFGK
jgi:hypothetical protein